MLPTPYAEDIVEAVQTALGALRRLSELPTFYDPSTDARQIKICMTDASHITLLPQLLEKLFELAPNIKLEVLPILPDVGKWLQEGDADLALGLIPTLEAGFFQQSLYIQDWVCLSSMSMSRRKGGFSRAAYEKAKHVQIVSGTGEALLEASLAEVGISRDIALKIPGFLGLAAILRSSDLVATVPRHIGQTLAENGGLSLSDCPLKIQSFKVKQYWHERYHAAPVNQWLRHVCSDLFQRSMTKSS